MVVEPQQFILGHIAEHGRTNILDEMGVALAAAVIVDDHFQEVGFLREILIAARRAEERVERVDVLDVEPDLEVLADRFHRGVHFSEHLVFAFVEEPVPQNDFRILDQQPPELDEVAVAGARTPGWNRQSAPVLRPCRSTSATSLTPGRSERNTSSMEHNNFMPRFLAAGKTAATISRSPWSGARVWV